MKKECKIEKAGKAAPKWGGLVSFWNGRRKEFKIRN